MPELPYQFEIEIARERVRDAVHAFSRAPTEANERRVNRAMALWRETKELRIRSDHAPRFTQKDELTQR